MADPPSAGLSSPPSDAAEGRSFWRYWVLDPIVGGIGIGMYRLLRVLPIDTAWVLGKPLGDFLRIVVFPRAARRVRNNWAWLRRDVKDPAVVDAAVKLAFRNAVATYLEFASLDRVWEAGRVTIEGSEHVAAAQAANRPILLMALHLGNWEVLGPAGIRGMGLSITAIHRGATNRFNQRIVEEARQRYGMKLIPPDATGGRIAFRTLASRKDALGIYVDEYQDGRVGAPYFGRPRRDDDNFSYVVRLAVMTKAAVLPVYILRQDGVRFRGVMRPEIPLILTGDREADVKVNAERINAELESIVRENLDQWLLTMYLRRKV